MPTLKTRAWVEVDLNVIRANVAALRAAVGPETQLMAVVKADAYGHGLLPVAQAAAEAEADWLGVAAVAEGVALREAGIAVPIALLCAPTPEEAETLLMHRLTALVGDTTTLNALAHASRSRPESGDPPEIHLEIDTGMGRAGVCPENAVALWREAVAAGMRVTGLATHFAFAEAPDESLNALQCAAFAQARTALEEAGARFDLIHLSNSAALLRYDNAGGNLVRPGLLLYGILPSIQEMGKWRNEEVSERVRGCEGDVVRKQATSASPSHPHRPSPHPPISLRPALTLKARVATVRALPAGHTLSYGATCRLTRASRVATVLIGYGDGYSRRLSNCGSMLLHGRRAPILGRVCMDQTVVDVTDIPGVLPGDEAVCIGAQGAERIRVEEVAALIDATEHEITTALTARLPRIYLPERLSAWK